jgi:hypothetical protein
MLLMRVVSSHFLYNNSIIHSTSYWDKVLQSLPIIASSVTIIANCSSLELLP